jgi:uncharacterized protein with von Willebrand factor type A (vWA) domain
VIDRLEEFAGLLRKNGVRVSTAEVIDGARALVAVGVHDGQAVRSALGATLIKRAGDAAVFAELFDLFFLHGQALVDGTAGAPLLELLAAAGLTPELIERILAQLAGAVGRLGTVARMGMGMRAPEIAPLVRAAGLQAEIGRIMSPLQVGYYTHRVGQVLDLARAEAEIDAVLARLVGDGARGLTEAEIGVVRDAVAKNLARLRAAIRDYVRGEFERQNLDYFQQMAARTLAEKPLSQLSDAEVAELRGEVARLARILRARVQLAPKVHRRGRLDVRRTLRRSLATGGVPFELRRRERRRRKPRLVVLCDISDSVRNVSRFMLQFVYTLQELFDRVQSFAFVSELGETTDLFRRHELDRAVELTYQGAVINVFANSNYGRVLEQFRAGHMDKVTPRTTVIVIGDGRNNYHPSQHAILGDIRRRAKQILWLNPEAPAAWGFGDSAMREYEPHCDKLVVAHNLHSLRKVVDELL